MMKLLMTLLALSLMTFGCGGKEEPASGGAGATASKADGFKMSKQAKTKWLTLCVSCHGKTGNGDGPAAANLNPKPRSFSDKAWQKTITDDHIAKIIVKGGAAVGKSSTMPPNPDLEGKQSIVDELVKKVRSYAE